MLKILCVAGKSTFLRQNALISIMAQVSEITACSLQVSWKSTS